MEITLAKHYGFCQGVKYALELANKVACENNQPIFMLNKIVHNQAVVDELTKKNIITLDDSRSLKEKINSIEKGTIIFSAHGHDKKLETLALQRNLQIVDATCPKVIANEKSINTALKNNKTVLYIGIRNHPETLASLSISEKVIFIDFFNPDYSLLKSDYDVSIHNQTTLIQEDLKRIYEEIKPKVHSMEIKNDICYATSLRQQSLSEVTDEDVIFIIGDKISSNSTRLYEVAKKTYPHLDIYQISSLNDLKNINLSQYKKGFVTAGASTPNSVINPILEKLKSN